MRKANFCPPGRPLLLTKISNLGIGSCIAALYLQTSQNCAKDVCGSWLTDSLGSEKTAWILFFVLGGASVAAVEGYFAFKSTEKIVETLNKHPERSKKISNGIKIVLLAIPQGVQPILVAIGTKAPPWALGLTCISVIPSSLFTSITLLETDIPYWSDRFLITIGKRTKLPFQDVVLVKLNDNWGALLRDMAHPNFQNLIPNDDRLSWLFDYKPSSPAIRESKSMRCLQGLMQFTNFSLLTDLEILFFLNTAKIFNDFIGGSTWGYVAAIFLTFALFYNILKVSVPATNTIYRGIRNLWQGQPVEWLGLRLRKTWTVTNTILSLLTASLSHATLAELSIALFPGNDAVRIASQIAIDWVHFLFLIHFSDAVIREPSINSPGNQNLIELESELNRINYMPSTLFGNQLVYQNYSRNQTSDLTLEEGKANDTDGDSAMELSNTHNTESDPLLGNNAKKSFCSII